MIRLGLLSAGLGQEDRRAGLCGNAYTPLLKADSPRAGSMDSPVAFPSLPERGCR